MITWDGAVFVQMRTRPPGAGPFAPMLTAAGWAAASESRWGNGWVLTASGPMSPSEARGAASRSHDEGVLGRTSALPQTLVTAVKDVRTVLRGTLGRRAAAAGPWERKAIPFVWQRHDPFERTGRILASRLGVPLVMAVHAVHVDEAAGWGVRRPLWGKVLREVGELRLIRSADLIACVTDEVAASVRRYLPERAASIVVIGSGIDRTHFRRDEIAGAGVRNRLGIPKNAFVIGWHGSFRKFHGLDHLIEAFACGLHRLPDGASLLLVGHGVHRARLAALAKERGVENRVFSPGEVPYDEIPAFLSAMDVGAVLADPNDNFHYSPLKLLEYQALGLPVVASRAGGMRDLDDGVDALVVEPGDINGLANAMVRLADDRELRSLIAQRGGQLASAHLWDSKLDALMESLDVRGLLQDGRRSR